jgi:hypothetical protein
MAFRPTDSVGTRIQVYFAAQWLAYALPCRRFADTLAGAYARLGANADRYSFIAVDLHHLLFAGLPAHLLKNSRSRVQKFWVEYPSALQFEAVRPLNPLMVADVPTPG